MQVEEPPSEEAPAAIEAAAVEEEEEMVEAPAFEEEAALEEEEAPLEEEAPVQHPGMPGIPGGAAAALLRPHVAGWRGGMRVLPALLLHQPVITACAAWLLPCAALRDATCPGSASLQHVPPSPCLSCS